MSKAIEAREWKTYAYSDSGKGKLGYVKDRGTASTVRDGTGNTGQL